MIGLPNWLSKFRKPTGSAVTPLEQMPGVLAVWDMQTATATGVDNLVGGTDWKLVFTNNQDATHNYPSIDSSGILFPAFEFPGLFQAVAGGTGSVSISNLSFYFVFKRIGEQSAGSFGNARVVDSPTILAIRNMDTLPETPTFFDPAGVTVGFMTSNWNDGNWHFVEVLLNSAGSFCWVDGGQEVNRIVDNGFPHTLSTFNFSNLTEGFAGNVAYGCMFNASHDAATRASVFSQIQARLASRSVTIAKSTKYLVIEGDSLSEPSYAGEAMANQYYYAALVAQSPRPPAINVAIHSSCISDLVARAAIVDSFYDATRSKNILSVFAGTNNFSLQGKTGAQTFAELKAYCLDRIAIGWEILLCDPPDRNEAGFTTFQTDLVTLIAGDSSFYHARAAFSSVSGIGLPGDSTNPVNFSDGVHWTDAGHALGKPVWQTALETLL